eukprot:CAMPEP_0197654880 /NCGR_PEP_ID=MMETSP1338-20131121/39114_1 /TAXON_ID=43686 ORGANISM="Pelagodinium beii, Strain RCC1491" /NCGR_SAMPLE_ID=MMETSP1338 /ASSEMBLY_ACC=CAM_ASM_000754 /LENGTH=640 /DNA_ID=CAMNT_0043230409 /DNA_START=65 /DNA_END=1987 /DNA_ORIENTATION=+
MADYMQSRLNMLEQELEHMRDHGMAATSSNGFTKQAMGMSGMPPVAPMPDADHRQRLERVESQLSSLLLASQGHQSLTTDHAKLTGSFNDLAKSHHELLQKYTDLLTAKGAPAAQLGPGPSPQVTNEHTIQKPQVPTLMDNTLLFLPERAVIELGLEPNMDDKGDGYKELWFGRLWELQELLKAQYELRHGKVKHETLSKQAQSELAVKLEDPKKKALLIRLQARWKATVYRLRCSFAVLRRLKFANIRGTLVYAHGSGGCSWDNMRICRMISKMGFMVIAPDGFAYPKDTAMGKIRHKDCLPLHKKSDDVDYWTGDLIYSSGSSGTHTYSTKAKVVLEKPADFRDLYEKCYQLRRSELHFTIKSLPQFIKIKGFFLGGTSEGGMTIARFDDQRYEEMVMGRFINSFSIEYCYFTPTPEAGELGGQIDVPTLNIIGTKDQYFGPEDSVAKIVASDAETGYGNANLTGNGFKTLARQGVEKALVCVLENGVHSPCNTHDNFLRQLFETFFSRPGSIWEIDAIWASDKTMSDLVQVQQQYAYHGMCLTQVFVPLPKFPNKWSLRKVEAVRGLAHSSAAKNELAQAFREDAERQDAELAEAKIMLDDTRMAVKDLAAKKEVKGSYYKADKMTTKKVKKTDKPK